MRDRKWGSKSSYILDQRVVRLGSVAWKQICTIIYQKQKQKNVQILRNMKAESESRDHYNIKIQFVHFWYFLFTYVNISQIKFYFFLFSFFRKEKAVNIEVYRKGGKLLKKTQCGTESCRKWKIVIDKNTTENKKKWKLWPKNCALTTMPHTAHLHI